MDSEQKFWATILAEILTFLLVLIALIGGFNSYQYGLTAKAANPLEFACAVSTTRDQAPACLTLKR